MISGKLVEAVGFEARTTLGLDETIRRGQLYARAGADLIFVASPESEDEFRQVAERVEASVMATMVDFGRSPLLPAARLEQLGYALAIFPATTWLVAVKAIGEAVSVLKGEGTSAPLHDRMATLEDYHRLMGFPRSTHWKSASPPAALPTRPISHAPGADGRAALWPRRCLQ